MSQQTERFPAYTRDELCNSTAELRDLIMIPKRTLVAEGNPYNQTVLNFTALPKEMTFNDDNLVSVIAYSCLFFVAAGGNLLLCITLSRYRGRKSRVDIFIMHLAIADLIVAFIMLPLETAWHITVSWNAGDVACRILMFFRAFGFYLSSFVLVSISFDRYFSIVHPMRMHDANYRGKIMLVFSWIVSAASSAPQSVIFHVETHPSYPWFKQCVTLNFFPTPMHELAYLLFTCITVYVIPLLLIIFAYTAILVKICKIAKLGKEQTIAQNSNEGNNFTTISRSTRSARMLVRRSNIGRLQKARIRTLKMTLIIVIAFIVCWTPYFSISAIWWFDKELATILDQKVQRGLFIFAVSNSCANPIIYGIFTTSFRKEVVRWKDSFQRGLNRIGFHSGKQLAAEQNYAMT